jgi:hypothetical protein
MRAPKSKTAHRRAQGVIYTRRWRERVKLGRRVYPCELDEDMFNLLEYFGELPANCADDREAVANALSKLLQRALAALMREDTARRGDFR